MLILIHVSVIGTSGGSPFKAWLPVVFIGACKCSDNYSIYLEIFHGFASCQPILIRCYKVHITEVTLLDRVFFTVRVGQTEGICSVVIVVSCIVIIISPNMSCQKLANFICRKGCLLTDLKVSSWHVNL